jgi:hypothetical protein
MTGLQLLSVTSILDVLNKEALVPWAAYRVADEICADPDYWANEVKRDKVDARRRLSAKALGSHVHQAAEDWAITGTRPTNVHPEVEPFLDHVGRMFDVYQPEWVASEMVVLHRGYGYAGQADGIWKTDRGTFLIDFKSTPKTHYADGSPRTPYSEVALQTSAYRNAELVIPWRDKAREKTQGGRWYTISDEALTRAVPMPQVDGTLAIHCTPAWSQPHELLSGDEEWLAFLHLLEVSRWVNGRGKNAVGPIFPPPGRSDVHVPIAVAS